MNTSWAIKHLSIELALQSWSPAWLHLAFHCKKKNPNFPCCIAFKYLNVISLTENTHSKQDVNRGFLVSFCLFHLVDRESNPQEGQYISYAYFISVIFLYCSPWGPVIYWVNYLSGMHCVIMEVQVYNAKCDCYFSISLFEITCQDVKMQVYRRFSTDRNLLRRVCICHIR